MNDINGNIVESMSYKHIKGALVEEMVIGTLSQREVFSFEYTILVNKKEYESDKYLINNI